MQNRKKLDVKELSLDYTLPKIKEIIYIQNCSKKISWNQESEDKIQSNYEKGLISILKKRKKLI